MAVDFSTEDFDFDDYYPPDFTVRMKRAEVNQREFNACARHLFPRVKMRDMTPDQESEVRDWMDERLERDVFSLMEVSGIGFDTCDGYADRLGGALEDPLRLSAALWTVLDRSEYSWHSQEDMARETVYFLDSKRFGDERARLNIGPNGEKAIRLRHIREIAVPRLEKDEKLVQEDGRWWLQEVKRQEEWTAAGLLEMTNLPGKHPIDVDAITAWKEHNTPSEAQIQGVRHAFMRRASCLVGPAGTGKSHTVNGIVHASERDVLLLSFTHTARKVLEGYTKKKAYTLSSFLFCMERKLGTKYETYSEIAPDAIWVVDEASMVPLWMMSRLVGLAIELNASIVLVGDPNQLYSISRGEVFHDVLGASPWARILVQELQENYRARSWPGLVAGAEAVLAGRMPKSGGGFEVNLYRREDEVLDQLVEDVRARHAAGAWTSPALWPRVFTGLNVSVNTLNSGLQDVFNPRPNERGEPWGVTSNDWEVPLSKTTSLRVGDRVVNTENHNGISLQNGDIGFVVSVDAHRSKITRPWSGRVLVDFVGQDDIIEYAIRGGGGVDGERQPFPLREIKLAYATTVHKGQGSECIDSYVAVPRPSQVDSRNSLYTAVTRGKESVRIFATKVAMDVTLRKVIRGKRQTDLQNCIKKASISSE